MGRTFNITIAQNDQLVLELSESTFKAAMNLIWKYASKDRSELLRLTKPLEDYNVYGPRSLGEFFKEETEPIYYSRNEMIGTLERTIQSLNEIEQKTKLDSQCQAARSAMMLALKRIQKLDANIRFETYLVS